MISLINKVALITGSARRIGADIVRELHAAGMNVVIHYRHAKQEAEALSLHLNQLRSNSAISFYAELNNIEDYPVHLAEVVNHWGRLDVLVNNASLFHPTRLGDISSSDYQDLFDSNVKAPLFLAQQAWPFLRESQGTIINIGDIHGEKPLKNHSVYCMSKSALLMMTQCLAQEMGPEVRVNAVSPGAIQWPEGSNSLSDHQKQSIIQQTALKRHGAASDVSQAVLFLIQHSYMTGQVLSVDGGRYLS